MSPPKIVDIQIHPKGEAAPIYDGPSVAAAARAAQAAFPGRRLAVTWTDGRIHLIAETHADGAAIAVVAVATGGDADALTHQLECG